jgi:hypothetical protein
LQVRDSWGEITDFTNATHPSSAQDSLSTIMASLTKSKVHILPQCKGDFLNNESRVRVKEALPPPRQ